MAGFPSIPNVIYWEFYNNNKIVKKTYICFANLSWDKNPKKIKYLCKIDDSLNNECLNFYFKFLSKILNKKIFNWKIITWKKMKCILWELNLGVLTKYDGLLYLTAFRYPHEFPEVILELFKHKEKSINDVFEEFQNIHHSISQNKIKTNYYNLSGHGLLYPYDVNFTPITLKDFKMNLKFPADCSVHKFFSKKYIFNKAKIKPVLNKMNFQIIKDLQEENY